MADVSHELGALRFVVDSSLSSKVAMFNNQAQQHKNSQLLNPFSQTDGRASSPKPNIPKEGYGKPLAGSLTEMRGQKANMHVMREMLELCQIINSEGYNVKDEPAMRVIPFGELFNIYNYISDKVVGILLRARKYKYVEFEGEMLFQRRDDDVPVFLLRPILEIRREIESKIEDIKRGTSPAPQSTSVLLDKSANEQRLKELAVPGDSQRNSKSRSQSPSVKSTTSTSKAPTPTASRAATPSPSPTSIPTTEVATSEAPPASTKPADIPVAQPAEAATTPATDAAQTTDLPTAELPTIVIEASATYVRRDSEAVDAPIAVTTGNTEVVSGVNGSDSV